VDWGHGNFGAEAASRAYFHTSSARLTRTEAAPLAAVLPDPSKWNAADPGPYVTERTVALRGRMQQVANDGLDWCVRN
jgi:monofunctional biosynthetic peptidoglycan transglycosylase